MVDHRAARTSPPFGLRLRHRLADTLVFRKIRHGLGGRLETMICGGAPLSPVVGRFFLGAGIPLYEGYGLTETSPVLAANRPDAMAAGNGRAAVSGRRTADRSGGRNPGPGADGHAGLLEQRPRPPAARSTGRAGCTPVTSAGSMRTASCTITDRIKELIVTAGGKKVAPQPIEGTDAAVAVRGPVDPGGRPPALSRPCWWSPSSSG